MTFRGWIGFLFIIAIGGMSFVLWPRLESDPPSFSEVGAISVGSAGTVLTIEVSDEGSGLRSFAARLRHAGGTASLASNLYPGTLMAGGRPGSKRIELELDPKKLKLADGRASIVVSARDWSMRDTGSGNRSELVVSLDVDTKAPRVAIESGLTYVARGGSGVAVYTLDEETQRDGIQVGDAFYRGYPMAGKRGRRVAFFAIPVGGETGPAVDVIAVDAAGNENKRSFPARVLERRFSEETISLPTRFLERVAVPLAESFGFESSDPTAAFARVNSEGRQRSEEQIRELITESTDERLWRGAFEQLPGSMVTSEFAESRSYLVNGKKISAATHYGFDLASTARDHITSSNSGSVLFTGPLGIYGDTVLVDHGQGIVSLYAHLSQIDVAKGDFVETGQRLGRSGDTGLAGGDHLHFAILIGNTYVDPLEWWDASWVRSHVEVRVTATGG